MSAQIFSRYQGETFPCRVISAQGKDMMQLALGFNRGSRDGKYTAHHTPSSMKQFLRKFGILPEDCALLQVFMQEEWTAVGAGLMAVDGDEAWCTGLAVDPEFRGDGGGKRLMLHLHEQARSRGVRHIWLEVLPENEAARRLYAGLGYQEQRELLIWERFAHQGELPAPRESLTAAKPAAILRAYAGWNELRPAWQRRPTYLRHFVPRMVAYTLPAKNGQPVAYALCAKQLFFIEGHETLNIFDLGVDPQVDFLEAAQSLLHALQRHYMQAHLLLINEPIESRFNQIFAALNFTVIDRQHEMVFHLPQ
jgi:ribosomal protein S18 acetylase RimI-like enzyme